MKKNLKEEQKYIVENSRGIRILAKVGNEVMTLGEILEFYGHESVDIDYNLTKQEIKDYDKRYMEFAIPAGGITEALSDIENGRINTYKSFDELLNDLDN